MKVYFDTEEIEQKMPLPRGKDHGTFEFSFVWCDARGLRVLDRRFSTETRSYQGTYNIAKLSAKAYAKSVTATECVISLESYDLEAQAKGE